ncbi:MAG TPA: VOC family protein [Chthoniobacteraceae bacterium]|nr:VOC family protein [Chthoniobacteraceae bacterium]
MKIERLDHLVLTVRSVEDTCHFYSTVLGMEILFFESGRRALSFGNQKINLHEAGSEIKPHASHPTVGSADLCFISDTPLPAVIEHLRPFGVKIIEGPVEHMGALGKIKSIYFNDPDNNLIEVGEYAEQAASSTDKKSNVMAPPPPISAEVALQAPDVGLRFSPLPPPPAMKPEVAVPVGAGGAKQFEPLPPPPPLKHS